MDLGENISNYIIGFLKDLGVDVDFDDLKKIQTELGLMTEDEIEDEAENIVEIFKDAHGNDIDSAIERYKIKKKEYMRELRRLQVELVNLQEWVVENNEKVLVIFEGRDAAGKGGVIKRITQRVNPRVCRVVALGKPTEKEKTQWYFQRYVPHLPAAGEIVLFDRSWYNRSGVERVMGFCTDEEYEEFMKTVPEFERMLAGSGIRLIKYWFSVSDQEQEFRFYCRMNDPLKQWKLSPMDLESRVRWEAYTKAKEDMFEKTNIPEAPWYVVPADVKKRARLNCIHHLLSLFDYKPVDKETIDLPNRKFHEDYVRHPVPESMIVPQVY